MHTALLHSHNTLRWIVIFAGIYAIVTAVQGLSGTRPFGSARRASLIFTLSLHLQLVLGMLLFVVSPFIKGAMANMKGTMADPATRFFIAEHPTMMVIAVVLATVGGIVAKNAATDASRHRKALVFTVITLLVILAAIPWQRPLFPGTGS